MWCVPPVNDWGTRSNGSVLHLGRLIHAVAVHGRTDGRSDFFRLAKVALQHRQSLVDPLPQLRIFH